MKHAGGPLIALMLCTAPMAHAQTYIALDVGGTIEASADGMDLKDDMAYRLGFGHDWGSWRVEGSAALLSSGVSFENMRAWTGGVALYRDIEVGDWTVYVGGGADYYFNATALQGVHDAAHGDGWGWRAQAGVSREIIKHVTGSLNLTYTRADMDFDAPVQWSDWELAYLSLGVRVTP